MKRTISFLGRNHVATGVAILAAFSAAALAKADPATVAIYSGGNAHNEQCNITAYGGGAIASGKPLVITTNSPYEGALITPATPIALGNIKEDHTRYLTVTIAVSSDADSGASDKPSAPKSAPNTGFPTVISMLPTLSEAKGVCEGSSAPAYPGGMQYPGYQGYHGGLGPQMNRGGAFPNQGNPNADQTQPAPQEPQTIQNIRFVLTTTKGDSVDYVRNISDLMTTQSTDESSDTSTAPAWITLAINLSAFDLSKTQAADASIKSIMIAGDHPGKIYLSAAKIETDSTALSAAISGDSDAALNSPETYTAVIKSGIANTVDTWTIDDGSEPFKGPKFTHTFTKKGVFHITLNVIDADGMEKAVTTNYTVTAQDQ